MNKEFLTPDNNEIIFSPGPGEVLIRGVISMNSVQFKLPVNLSLQIERKIDGIEKTEEIHINSYISPDDHDLSAVEFPLKHRAYDSYMKLPIVDNSEQKVDFKIDVPVKWTSQR
ncbi:hypothetical protein GCM10009118_08000 [Wandonia haliotis]|uniref:Arrestin-like N-terminal domain-containing protein n=1 Tax=Wandonia haliotis TaxID=574963 RepID=A0ABP3Y0G7_9FLAO